jgi:hypothetical protein
MTDRVLCGFSFFCSQSAHFPRKSYTDPLYFDVTGIDDWLSVGVTYFLPQCSAAVNQRETVASGQTRERSKIEFLLVVEDELRVDPYCVHHGPAGAGADIAV